MTANPPVSVLADGDGSVVWTTTYGFGFYLAANDTTLFTVAGDLYAFPIGGCGTPTCTPAWTGLLSAAVPLNGLTLTGHVVIVPRWEQDGFYFDADGCGATVCSPLPGGAAPGILTPGAVSVIGGRIYSTMSGGLTTFEVKPG